MCRHWGWRDTGTPLPYTILPTALSSDGYSSTLFPAPGNFELKPALAPWSLEAIVSTFLLSQPAQGPGLVLCLKMAAVTKGRMERTGVAGLLSPWQCISVTQTRNFQRFQAREKGSWWCRAWNLDTLSSPALCLIYRSIAHWASWPLLSLRDRDQARSFFSPFCLWNTWRSSLLWIMLTNFIFPIELLVGNFAHSYKQNSMKWFHFIHDGWQQLLRPTSLSLGENKWQLIKDRDTGLLSGSWFILW